MEEQTRLQLPISNFNEPLQQVQCVTDSHDGHSHDDENRTVLPWRLAPPPPPFSPRDSPTQTFMPGDIWMLKTICLSETINHQEDRMGACNVHGRGWPRAAANRFCWSLDPGGRCVPCVDSSFFCEVSQGRNVGGPKCQNAGTLGWGCR